MEKQVSKEGAVKSTDSKVCYSRWCTYVNKDCKSKMLPPIEWSNRQDRVYSFARYYWQDYDKRKWIWFDSNIDPTVMLCIAWADSHLWYALKSKNNFGNVGNNDRWDTISYSTPEQGIKAIARVLNNKYLREKQTIWDLSFAWNCRINCTKAYATSKDNRQNNVLNCLSHISNKKEFASYYFRQSY